MDTEGRYKKIIEISEEMKRLNIWKDQPPDWVNEFVKQENISSENFTDWLQFVYLPNRLQPGRGPKEAQYPLIVPQAIRYFSSDVRKGRLLQLLIELDSL